MTQGWTGLFPPKPNGVTNGNQRESNGDWARQTQAQRRCGNCRSICRPRRWSGFGRECPPYTGSITGAAMHPSPLWDDWAQILGGRSLDDIGRALSRFQSDPGRFPPGAGEFSAQCREFQPGTFAGAALPQPTHAPMLAVEGLKPRTKVGKQWMAYMRLRGLIPMGRAHHE